MTNEIASLPQHAYEEAKSDHRKAQDTWRKVSNAYFRLFRERQRERRITGVAESEVSEAETEAERAYNSACAALGAARERLRQVEIALAKPRAVRRKRLVSSKDEWDEESGDEG